MVLETLDQIKIPSLGIDPIPNTSHLSNAARMLESLSTQTWHRLKYSELMDVSQSEETITDIHLLDMKLTGFTELKVWKCPKREEAKIGIDWWWLIGSDNLGWRSYMVQAKRLDLRTRRYSTLGYKVRERAQIDILEEEAGKRCAFPLFCFYNYANLSKDTLEKCLHCPVKPLDESQLGCTVTPLPIVKDVLKRRSRPSKRTFEYIHSESDTIPWRCLVRCRHSMTAYRDARNTPMGYCGPVIYKRYDDIPVEVRNLFDASENGLDAVVTATTVARRVLLMRVEEFDESSHNTSSDHVALPVIRAFGGQQ